VAVAAGDVTFSGSPCWTADFDGDGDVATDADIEAFFACLGGDCCPYCASPDFDGDGQPGTDADIEAFFRVLAGGAVLRSAIVVPISRPALRARIVRSERRPRVAALNALIPPAPRPEAA